MARGKDFLERIKRTSNDLTTLEINTIVKSDMSCVKPPDNDRLALYQLAGKYHIRLVELSKVYFDCLQSKEIAEELKAELEAEKVDKGGTAQNLHVENYLFRRIPCYEQGGIVSFVELAMAAKKANRIITDHYQHFNRTELQIDNDLSMLSRIELKSLEMVTIIADLIKKKDVKVYEAFWQAYAASNNVNRFQYFEHLHDIIWKGVKLNENTTADFLKCDDFEFTLDLRDQILIRKALDIGTERVLMQTRIGMDGDVTTRISEKFAEHPEQFILDIHNDAIQTSVSYWSKIIDALVRFGSQILKYF